MELPCELVDEILIRVPVKYLLRCRSVSKRWCGIIDSTQFVEKHLKESIEKNRGGIIIQGSALDASGWRYLLADLESFDNGDEVIDISEEVKGILDDASLVGSANGLVCLSMSGDADVDSIILLNPSTRKFKKLPTSGTDFLECNNLSSYFLCGFGYDRVSDDYRVVMMAWCNLPTNGIMAIVYSLKKNSWTPNPNVFSTENIGVIDYWGMLADGAVLWKAVDVTSQSSVIFGFDLSLEEFIEPTYYDGDVRLMNTCLENSQAGEISANPIYRGFRSPRILTYSKSFDKILVEVDHQRFVWYDFKSKAFKNVSVPGIPAWFIADMYIESLFPLIEDRQPSHEAKEKMQQPKKRFSKILLALGSVVASLMFIINRSNSSWRAAQYSNAGKSGAE